MLSTLRGRGARWTATVVVAVATVLVATATPASAATGTITTSGSALTVRRAPSTSATAVGTIANGTAVTIDCQTTGTSVTGTYGTSTTWDYIPAKGGYVSDTYVYTGSDGRVAPDCGVGSGSAQCTPGACAGEGQFRSSDGHVLVYDKAGDGHSAVVQYWLKGGVGPLTVWNPNGSGTTVDQAVTVAAGSWIFYKVCLGEYGTKSIVAGSCSAGITDYR